MDSILGIGGFVVGVVGVVLTIFYARKAERLNRMRKRLEWPDLQAASSDLGERIKSTFKPDLILTPGLTGATFANLLVTDLSENVPVFVGTRLWKDSGLAADENDHAFVIETKKWYVSLPSQVLDFRQQRVLIVDDFVMSGDFLDQLREKLVAAGYEADNIAAAAIAVTKVAIKNHKAPNYYWWVADDDDFFFPWGKAK